MITVYYNGKPYQYADSTKYLELARTLQPQFEHDIVLASVNGKLQELWKYIKDGASVSFLTTQSQAGIIGIQKKRRQKAFVVQNCAWRASNSGESSSRRPGAHLCANQLECGSALV